MEQPRYSERTIEAIRDAQALHQLFELAAQYRQLTISCCIMPEGAVYTVEFERQHISGKLDEIANWLCRG